MAYPNIVRDLIGHQAFKKNIYSEAYRTHKISSYCKLYVSCASRGPISEIRLLCPHMHLVEQQNNIVINLFMKNFFCEHFVGQINYVRALK